MVRVTYLDMEQKWKSKSRSTRQQGTHLFIQQRLTELSLSWALVMLKGKQQCLWYYPCSCGVSGLMSWKGNHAELDCFLKHQSVISILAVGKKNALQEIWAEQKGARVAHWQNRYHKHAILLVRILNSDRISSLKHLLLFQKGIKWLILW